MNRKLNILIVLIVLFGCTSDRDEATKQPVEMHFDVDQELLGETIVSEENEISFQPPKQWELLAGDVFQEAIRQFTRMQSAGDTFSIQPAYIFLHHRHGSVMIISEITVNDDKITSPDIVQAFRRDVNAGLDAARYQEAEFLKNGLLVYQYLIQDDDTVNFKFLFQNKNNALFQVDYIVPRSVYAAESKAVESSIGSIHVVPH